MADGRGEFTLVIAPQAEETTAAAPEGGLEDFVAELLRAGCPTNPIVTALRARGMSRGDAYALVQRLEALGMSRSYGIGTCSRFFDRRISLSANRCPLRRDMRWPLKKPRRAGARRRARG